MTIKDLIKKHEGLRLHPYKCTAGKLTIGWGRNIEDKGISELEAEDLLDNDISDTIGECKRHLGWFDRLDPVRKIVVADMVFNLGVQGFLKFKKTIGAISQCDYNKAADEMKDSAWYEQVGTRGAELVEMMRTGRA